jgi:recombination protein RecR
MASATREIDALIEMMAKLPGLGPRSARRAVLHLIRKRTTQLSPLATAMAEVARTVRDCLTCGNIGTTELCEICSSEKRATGEICVVEDVADLWALERAGVGNVRYHVLGGVLSPLDGVGPDDLSIDQLFGRTQDFSEIVLAINATVEGQTTAHYVTDRLAGSGVKVTRLAHGVPVGGELDYLDEGTLSQALRARTEV